MSIPPTIDPSMTPRVLSSSITFPMIWMSDPFFTRWYVARVVKTMASSVTLERTAVRKMERRGRPWVRRARMLLIVWV